MLGLNHWDLILILLVVFILFGHRLPSMMRHLGRGVIAFRDPWSGEFRMRQEPKPPEPISLTEWLVILALLGVLAALLLPGWAWTD